MDAKTHLLLSGKLLGVCGRNENAIIYSLLPMIDNEPKYFYRLNGHVLENFPRLLDCAFATFFDEKLKNGKDSYEYSRLKEEKENFRKLVSSSKYLFGRDNIILSNDKVDAALALVSHSYFDTFSFPVQFFLPHSSLCCGQWDFWDSVDYLKFRDDFHDGNIINEFTENLRKSEIWNLKLKIEDFLPIIKKRLEKEKTLEKDLNREAMIKAMIIRTGELGKPSISYEIVDYTIRNFLRYLNIDKYLRVDREILFLRKLEEEIKNVLRNQA